MVKSGMYSDVQVAPNLDIDMSKVEKAVHNYSHNDGQDQGELTESSEYNSEAKVDRLPLRERIPMMIRQPM